MAALQFEYGTMGYKTHRAPNTMLELVECQECRLYHVKGEPCSHEPVASRLPPSPQDEDAPSASARKAKP